MNIIFSTLLELVASAVFLIPIYLLLNKALFHNIKKSIFYCVFSFYLAAVFVLVGMPNITYIRLDFNLNAIPFAGFIAGWRSSMLNILLFVPLGILLPILWKKYRAKKNTVLFGFGMSLAIELLQIFTLRATDVNDLITNVLGTCLGFCFAKIWTKKIPVMKGVGKEDNTNELYLVCAVVFIVMFFMQPFLSRIMWNLILF